MGRNSRKRARSSSSSSSSEDSETRYWRRKCRKLERKYKKRTRSPSVSSDSDKENGDHDERERTNRDDRVDVSDHEGEILNVVHDNDDGEGQALDPLFVDVGPPLSKEILDLLGKDTGPSVDEGNIIHSDIAAQWTDILVNGLSEDVRTQLIAKYPPHKNCCLMGAPQVNPEAKAASVESALKRDEKLQAVQIQLGASLAALGKGLTLLLGSKEEEGGENLQLIEVISDASRLLSDLHHQESEVRKVLLNHNFNKDLREVVLQAKSDMYLFGENLGDRIKAAKAMEKSGEELKIRKSLTKTPFRGNLNSKGPLKRLPNSRVSGPRQTFRSQKNYHGQDNRGKFQVIRKESRRFRKDYR